MAAGDFTPYSTVTEYIQSYPGWVPVEEQERIASYALYEEIYWSHPTTFRLVFRGSENKPIYLPAGRVIVDTMNRYLGRGFDFTTTAAAGATAGAEQTLADTFLRDFWARERMKSVFSSAKLYGLMRGDWVFHITADPLKLPGKRISIKAIDPGMWFPVYDDDDLDKLIKVHLAEQYTDSAGKQWIKRQTYERADNGQILHSIGLFDPDKAFKADGKATVDIVKQVPLPPAIDTFPVYAIRNTEQPQNPYGSSEMRGLERLFMGMNQAISDEDITLALNGLGVYFTNGGGPTDAAGNDLPWSIAPGSVLENVDQFERVQGVTTVQPFTDHIATMWSYAQMASGASDVAIGNVDVTVAESGIALALRMGPILARAEDKLDIVSDVMTQLLYDLRRWFLVYESVNMEATRFTPTFKDPLPTNKKGEIDLVTGLVEAKIMSTQTARVYIESKKLGITFDANEAGLIADETSTAAAAADPFGAAAAANGASEPAVPDASADGGVPGAPAE
jgi:hypothetical protein